MKDIHTSIRVSSKNEAELYQFVKSKGGVKKALSYLFNQYQLNQKIDNIVDRIKDEMQFVSTPTIKVKNKVDNNEQVNDMLSGFGL